MNNKVKKRKHRHVWVFVPHHYSPGTQKPYGYGCKTCGETMRSAKNRHRHRYLPMNYDKPTCKCGKRKGD